ncbi:uncharacterized protein LOC108090372 [Drosophila ficusphila]|uniref:uncharacterized protein LOC108090372 n=1 Tax=Drosophila ficusphila TaxID=30025 RepID=UPI0007E69A88|nr:uncharacterized protein LOC108090372 [Drosophila ficusphila]
MLTSKLRLRPGLMRLSSRCYNWGNYDASSGECCKMRDKETTECSPEICPLDDLPNNCYERSPSHRRQYSKYLQEIYLRGKPDPDCALKLIRHDELHYKPSDKHRKFQRTWPECPLIWLRPKDVCCPNPEKYPPMKRRVRPPQQPPLSAIERHLFQMDLFCKAVLKAPGCRQSRRPPKCKLPPSPSDCCKKPAPMPSFSEACRHLIPRYCGIECSCHGIPSACEALNAYQRWNKSRRSCIKPLIGYSPYRSKMRFPF